MERICSGQLRAIGVEVLPLIDGRQPRTARLAALGWQGFAVANRRSGDDWCDAGELTLHHQMAEEDLQAVLRGAQPAWLARGIISG